jgi:hypothetical protein
VTIINVRIETEFIISFYRLAESGAYDAVDGLVQVAFRRKLVIS